MTCVVMSILKTCSHSEQDMGLGFLTNLMRYKCAVLERSIDLVFPKKCRNVAYKIKGRRVQMPLHFN